MDVYNKFCKTFFFFLKKSFQIIFDFPKVLTRKQQKVFFPAFFTSKLKTTFKERFKQEIQIVSEKNNNLRNLFF